MKIKSFILNRIKRKNKLDDTEIIKDDDRIYKYDSKGNLIYYKENDFESIREYDENGDLMHIKNSNGYEGVYDIKNGNYIIDFSHTNGDKYIYSCNQRIKKIHCIKSDGSEYSKEYDEKWWN